MKKLIVVLIGLMLLVRCSQQVTQSIEPVTSEPPQEKTKIVNNFTEEEIEIINKFKKANHSNRINEGKDLLEVLRKGMREWAEGVFEKSAKNTDGDKQELEELEKLIKKSARESILDYSKYEMDENDVVLLLGEPDHKEIQNVPSEKEPTQDDPYAFIEEPRNVLYYTCGIMDEFAAYYNITFYCKDKPAKIMIGIDCQSNILPANITKAEKEIPEDKLPLYLKVIEKVKDGTLKPDNSGIITLPDEFRDASAGKEIYVSIKENGGLWVVFKIAFGRHRNLAGYLYTTQPLENTDYYITRYAGPEEFKAMKVGPVHELILGNKLNENWYFVSFSLD